jgi:hypothetical protein
MVFGETIHIPSRPHRNPSSRQSSSDLMDEIDGLTPDREVSRLLRAERELIEVMNDGPPQRSDPINPIDAFGLGAGAISRRRLTDANDTACPVGADHLQDRVIIVSKGDRERCRDVGMASRGIHVIEYKRALPIGKTRKPMSESVAIDAHRERRDGRLLGSHGMHLLQGVSCGQGRPGDDDSRAGSLHFNTCRG